MTHVHGETCKLYLKILKGSPRLISALEMFLLGGLIYM